MQNFFISILDVFFPKKETTAALERLARFDGLSSLPSAPEAPAPWMHAIFHYKDKKVRQLVWEIKYTGNTALIHEAGKVLLEEILSFFDERAEFAAGTWVLVPIPPSKTHAKEKGFNQTEELCVAIMKNGGSDLLTYSPHALEKVRETEPQAKMRDRRKRLENLKGAFAVSDDSLVRGKNIIVIDDVVTTGSTFVEASRALKEAGAKRVLALALAH